MSQLREFLLSKSVIFIVSIIILFFVSTRIVTHVMGTEKHHQLIVDKISKFTDGKQIITNGNFQVETSPILNKASIIIPELKIIDKKNGSLQEFFSAKNFVINLSLMDFIFGNISFKSIKIKDANLFLEIGQDETKNWGFIYNSQNNNELLADLDTVEISNINIFYKDNDLNLQFSRANLELDFNEKHNITLQGDFILNDNSFKLDAKIANKGNNKSQKFDFNLIGNGVNSKINGEVINNLNKFQADGDVSIILDKPYFVTKKLVKIFPFLSNAQIPDQLKEELNIKSKLSIADNSIQFNDLTIKSTNTNGNGDIKIFLKEKESFSLNMVFESLDLTNFFTLNNDEILRNLSNNNSEAADSYLNFNIIDDANAAINIKANKITMNSNDIKNFQFDIKINKGIAERGNLFLDFNDSEYSTSIKLQNLNFQKIEDTHLVLGDFSNSGVNIDEALKLFKLNNYISIKGNKLNYNFDSKIIFSSKEISLFDINGSIGDSGSFIGSISSTHNDLNHYNFDLKFNDLKLADIELPSIKDKVAALAQKSASEDYLTYFRWFRTLSSTYKFKLEMNNTDINGQKIERLTTLCKLSPGIMNFKIQAKSDITDGIYQLDLTANELKPTLDIKTNVDHLKFEQLRSLMLNFLQKEPDIAENTQATNELWSSKKLDIFHFYKYATNIDISIKDLQLNELNPTDLRFIAHTSNKILYIDDMYFKIFGGESQIRGNINFFDQLLYQFSYNTSGMESNDVIANFFPYIDGIKGKFAATGSIIMQGNTPKDLISSMQFTSNFIAPDFDIKDVDTDAIVEVALKRKNFEKDKVLTTLDNLLNSSKTKITDINGSLKGKNGIIKITNTTFKTRFSEGVYGMTLDLNNLTMSSNLIFVFAPYVGNTFVNFKIAYSGKLDEQLKREVDSKDLEKFVKNQYKIVTEEDIKEAKQLEDKRRKALAIDQDSKDFLYYKLKQKLEQQQEKINEQK
ncbi:MAG: AsmA-like C-terminal region-containing protein [Pseudomonadota bacterium]